MRSRKALLLACAAVNLTWGLDAPPATASPDAPLSTSPQLVVAAADKSLADNKKLGKVTVEGNQHYSTQFILYLFRPVQAVGEVRVDLLERLLRLMNEFPDLSVKAVLRPGADGATDVVLKVQDKAPFHGEIEYDNFGNDLTGINRAGATLSWGNLSGRGDTFILKGLDTFPSTNSQPLLQGTYDLPISSQGDRLGVQFSSGQFGVGGAFQALAIEGQADILGITDTHPLDRSDKTSTNLTVGYFQKSIRDFDITGPTGHDELREFVLGYGGYWFGGGHVNNLQTSVTQGLGGSLGGTPSGAAGTSRAGASDSFTKLNLDDTYLFKAGRRNFVKLRGSLQLASNTLSVAEAYPLGGADSVRGYQQGEVLGDSAWVLSAEYTIPLTKTTNDLQGALFADTGGAYLSHPIVGQPSSTSLTGAGVGVRANLGTATFVRLDVGFPLSPSPNGEKQHQVFYGQVSEHF